MRTTDATIAVWLAVLALIGAVVVPQLVRRGIRQLGQTPPLPESLEAGSPLDTVAVAAGALAGCAAVLACHRAGSSWLLPALAVWAGMLVAAAMCDGLTQRVPTALTRQGTVATVVLLVVAAVGSADYRGLVIAAVASLAGGIILAACWRWAGAGFGDVRLAVLGGLGLGHATLHGLVFAGAAVTMITLAQALVVLVRGGTRRTPYPLGPALAAGFLLAAVG